MDYSKDITIVVITFNRYSYLKRLLNFYEQYEIKFNFLILDSSSGKISEELDQYLQNQEHINHQRYGSDIFFADKIAEGCKHIKTPYVTLCADDDFLIPSGVIQAKEFLTQNSDYSSAHGLYFNHSSVEGSSKFGFHISPLYADGHSAEDNLPLERITAYLSGKTKYYPMYAVHQTELFQTIWSETKEYVSDWGLSELFPCALSLACGKMKVLPIFYASREPNVFSWCDENRLREMYSEAKIDKSINGITKQIKLIEKQPIEANHQYLKELFENYLRKTFLKKSSSKVDWISSLRKIVGLRTRINQIFYGGCHPSVYQSFDDYIKVRKSVMESAILENELTDSRAAYSSQKKIKYI